MTPEEAESVLEGLLKRLEVRHEEEISRAKKAVGVLADAARWTEAYKAAAQERLERYSRLLREYQALRAEKGNA